MLNSGEKNLGLARQKNIYILTRDVRKINSERNKKTTTPPPPPPPLQVKWSVPNATLM